MYQFRKSPTLLNKLVDARHLMRKRIDRIESICCWVAPVAKVRVLPVRAPNSRLDKSAFWWVTARNGT